MTRVMDIVMKGSWSNLIKGVMGHVMKWVMDHSDYRDHETF